MLRALIQEKVGRQSQRFNCVIAFGALLILGSGLADLHAEMIPAVERTGSTKLLGIIEGESSVFDRLLSWSEFAPANAAWGAQTNPVVSDLVELPEDPSTLRLNLPPVVGMYQGGASNSLDSSSSSSSVAPLYAANLSANSGLSDPVVLLYWRGRDFLHIPDAPSSGLFRPPRRFLSGTAT